MGSCSPIEFEHEKVNCCSLSVSYLEVISGAAGSLPEIVVSHKTLHPLPFVRESEGKKKKKKMSCLLNIPRKW